MTQSSEHFASQKYAGPGGDIPSWLNEACAPRTLGTAAVGIASIMFGADAAQAQQQQAQNQSGASSLPTVQVQAPRVRRATPQPRPVRRAAQPRRAPAPVAASAPVQPQGGTFGTPSSSPNTLTAGTGLARMPRTIQETPQTVNVVSEQTIREQQITTIDQALRNVPGVTSAAGEGGGGLNGDQFRIRGFDAKGDVYVDGLRDFGVYVRDAFNVEQIQVFKGPSSEGFGMGTTGGAINIQSKQAKLGNVYEVGGVLGQGFWGRGTFDVNQQLSATQALRVTGMINSQDVVGRNHVFSDRAGAAISYGTGLGTNTSWHLNYFYQHNDRMPESGVPMVSRGNGTDFVPSKANPARPVTELGLPRDIFYGKDTDKDISDAHMLTSKLKHEIAPWLTITNDSRLSYFERSFSTTIPGCNGAVTASGTANPGGNGAATCAGQFFAGSNAPLVANGGGNPTYDDKSLAIQNLTTLNGKFNVAGFRHEAVLGLDVFYAQNDRQLYSVVGTKANQPIRTPIFASNGAYSFVPNPNNTRSASGTDVGVFVGDRMWLTEQFSILAGVRWDHLSIDSFQRTQAGTPVVNTVTSLSQSTSFTTPRISLIYEPWKNQIFYANYAESATPAGQLITNSSQNVLNAATPNLEPEKNKTYEVGYKLSLFDNKLGFTTALFQVEKNNARFTDPTTGDSLATGETQRVRGVELGLTGQLTKDWNVLFAYSYMDGRVTAQTAAVTAAAPSVVGNRIQGVAFNNASLWTTYNLSSLIDTGRGKLTYGAGIFYRGEVYTSSANNALVPQSFSLDMMLAYEWDKYRVAINAYNLTDNVNYDTFQATRAIPGAGRTVMITGAARW
ncbi:putative TonB-dependent receptor BfrD precursor [Variibacter gotjawalensis]|uniref:Putative TonB-dependent receptor BfrD n=1 Tax=Variibacter gotjawalensis TaxID=1333996 RepID=A0A0S3PZS8_9BRAD|nr:TonB-dependent receptor [Variibacter gotjawalensis]NIK47266.1 catecholate siderophore receptor [Variibacter gotjawalensis]RZS49166.1 catecholate siderophore receptor [Variibacter gotjawalensis]BAT61428.1 putative TonB-dependent receptor BfrD precursor [Variibacter gotjawalensis]